MDGKFLIFSFFSIALMACKSDDSNLRKSIVGTWDVYSSEMNGKSNGFMKDAFFIFQDDNLVQSNTIPQNEKLSYIVDNSKLEINGIDNFKMDIVRLDSDTLWLEGKMSYYHMKYHMVRRK